MRTRVSGKPRSVINFEEQGPPQGHQPTVPQPLLPSFSSHQAIFHLLARWTSRGPTQDTGGAPRHFCEAARPGRWATAYPASHYESRGLDVVQWLGDVQVHYMEYQHRSKVYANAITV